MFTRFFNYINEGFDSSSSTDFNKLATALGSSGTGTINNFLEDRSPVSGISGVNMGYSTDPVNQHGKINSAVNSLLGGYIDQDLLNQNISACEKAGSGSQFNRLSFLASSVDTTSAARCGWVYNTANPDNGRAAYGTRDGPLRTSAKGEWMWDLPAAKKRYHIAICSEIKDCQDLADPRYTNICGFCTSSAKAVPVTGGTSAYPYDGNNSCSQSSLVLTQNKCPAPPPPPPAGSPAAEAYNSSKNTCDPLGNGAISRGCIISKAIQAGCTDKGTLITALSSGSDTDYLNALRITPAYVKYQERAKPTLNETALQFGKLGVADALSGFRVLYDNAASTANTGLKAAAADLCFTKGLLDKFDFCSEILDSSIGPYSLECLQKEFMKAGGQMTGSMFPTRSNLSMWNSYPSWAAVKSKIQALKASASTSPREGFIGISDIGQQPSQKVGMQQFYGIAVDGPKPGLLANIKNVESFWFTSDTSITSSSTTYATTFLGRRIRANIPKIPLINPLKGGVANKTSIVYFTQIIPASNMQFNLKFTGDSGFIFSKNKPMLNVYSGNGEDTANNTFSSLYPQFNNPYSQLTTSSPWTITTTGPNIITGYYLGNGVNHLIEYSPVSASSSIKLSSLNGYDVRGGGGYPQFKSENTVKILYDASAADFFNNPSKYIGNSISGDRINGTSTIVSISSPYNEGDSSVSNYIQLYDVKISGTFTNTSPQTGTIFSFNVSLATSTWSEIPEASLYLIQDPYAPMISFNVLQNYADYNCDYAFCDKRLGSHKMKWSVSGGNGPTPDYDSDAICFGGGSGIMSMFRVKLYSFLTAIFKVIFSSLPSNGALATPFSILSTYPITDSPAIFLRGIGNNQASINVGSANNTGGSGNTTNGYGCTSPPMTTDGPTITTGVPYLITLRLIRTTENDITTVNSLSVGVGSNSDLQADPSKLKESSPLVWPNAKSLSDPDSGTSNYFLITGSNCTFDLFSLELYDYPVNGDNLKHAAKNDWAQIQTNIYT